MNIMEHTKKVKNSLIGATNAVRLKFQQLKKKDQLIKQKLADQYQPITKKLNDLIALNNFKKQPSKSQQRIDENKNGDYDDDDDDEYEDRRSRYQVQKSLKT